MGLASTFGDLFASGHAIDFVLAVMVAEAAVLLIRGRRPPLDCILALLPGALLLLALRSALTGAPWLWVALFVTASLPVHLADLRRRGV